MIEKLHDIPLTGGWRVTIDLRSGKDIDQLPHAEVMTVAKLYDESGKHMGSVWLDGENPARALAPLLGPTFYYPFGYTGHRQAGRMAAALIADGFTPI